MLPTNAFDPATAAEQEAQRRHQLLGDLSDQPYNKKACAARAQRLRVPESTLAAYWLGYNQEGIRALTPEYQPLTEKSMAEAQLRYEWLQPALTDEGISSVDIAKLADLRSCSISTAIRWINRYQAGGLWALTPEYNPLRPAPTPEAPPPDWGTLDEATLITIYQRQELLGDLINGTPSVREIEARAAEVGVTSRTLWDHLSRYRKYGMRGLAPKRRSDKGSHYKISSRMVKVIQGIRLSHPDLSVNAVHERAVVKASQLGEINPSPWQVRQICDEIAEPVKLLADGRESEFRSKYGFTQRMRFEGMVWQVDHTPIDVLAIDLRATRYRTLSGEVRPWLTTVVDSLTRLVVGFRLGYDRPDRNGVAAAIRVALLQFGIPDEIWVDNGKELISNHIYQITRDLGIQLHDCPPHHPQHRGIGERFFGTLNTRLWARLEGYVGSNVTERNPNAKAKYTPHELEEILRDFIQGYNNEVHSSLDNVSPLQYWTENCFTVPIPDRRVLDLLLQEQERRKVLKQKISFQGQAYWHPDLGPLVGEDVLIRADTTFGAPDEIEVFHRERWICTAFAYDSERDQRVTHQEIAKAQREQRRSVRREIDTARSALEAAEIAIQARETKRQLETGTGIVQSTTPTQSEPETSKPKPRPKQQPVRTQPHKDLLDRMWATTDAG